MNLTDFFIGLLLMNAMPHFIFGISKIKFLGLFGFSPAGNIIYGGLQFVICILLFHFKYGIAHIAENGIFVGAVAILVIYFVTGKLLLTLFNRSKKENEL
jgi:hypothetical protein